MLQRFSISLVMFSVSSTLDVTVTSLFFGTSKPKKVYVKTSVNAITLLFHCITCDGHDGGI